MSSSDFDETMLLTLAVVASVFGLIAIGALSGWMLCWALTP